MLLGIVNMDSTRGHMLRLTDCGGRERGTMRIGLGFKHWLTRPSRQAGTSYLTTTVAQLCHNEGWHGLIVAWIYNFFVGGGVVLNLNDETGNGN